MEYWIAVRHGWLPHRDFSDDQFAVATKKAAKWFKTEGIKHLTDPVQIAAWLHDLIAEYGDRDAPRALHGEDYNSLLGVQERVYDRIIHAVFSDDEFTHICKTALYAGYEAASKASGEKGKILDRALYAKANAYIKRNKLTWIEERRERQDTGRNTIWFDNRKPEHVRRIDNTSLRYVSDYGKWIGPEV